MITCPECNGDKVIEVQKPASLYSSQPHFENIICPGCNGEGSITRHNTLEEVKVKDLSSSRWQVKFTRLDTVSLRTGSWSSAVRLEKVLSKMVNEGQLSIIYESLTRGVITFRPAELQF